MAMRSRDVDWPSEPPVFAYVMMPRPLAASVSSAGRWDSSATTRLA